MVGGHFMGRNGLIDGAGPCYYPGAFRE
jgi:hypothetical protein